MLSLIHIFQIGQTACIAFQVVQLNINNAGFLDFIFRNFHGLLTGSTGCLLYTSHALVTENDLEQSILDNLQPFLLEMGHGFCFETRQKRILIDEDYFFTDLVFYHQMCIRDRKKCNKKVRPSTLRLFRLTR